MTAECRCRPGRHPPSKAIGHRIGCPELTENHYDGDDCPPWPRGHRDPAEVVPVERPRRHPAALPTVALLGFMVGYFSQQAMIAANTPIWLRIAVGVLLTLTVGGTVLTLLLLRVRRPTP